MAPAPEIGEPAEPSSAELQFLEFAEQYDALMRIRRQDCFYVDATYLEQRQFLGTTLHAVLDSLRLEYQRLDEPRGEPLGAEDAGVYCRQERR